MLFLGRTGCQWRYLPEPYGPWGAVWKQWCRWRANGVWARAMTRWAAIIRMQHDREALPSMVMIDAQTVKGGRYGPTCHEAGGRGGRTIGTKRTRARRDPRVARRGPALRPRHRKGPSVHESEAAHPRGPPVHFVTGSRRLENEIRRRLDCWSMRRRLGREFGTVGPFATARRACSRRGWAARHAAPARRQGHSGVVAHRTIGP